MHLISLTICLKIIFNLVKMSFFNKQVVPKTKQTKYRNSNEVFKQILQSALNFNQSFLAIGSWQLQTVFMINNLNAVGIPTINV